MKKIVFAFASFLLSFYAAFATHNRAGEITYECLGQLQYRVTITTYTKTSGISIQADRPVLDSVHWGDNTTSSFNRIQFVDLAGQDIRVNTYVNTHTYPGPGTFDIHFEDPNRNSDVVNIPGSVNVPFFLHTTLVINPFLGSCDNSPILLQPPIDRGCTGVPFIHNPNAYDPDGDSISYVLTDCLGHGGVTASGYFLPSASNSLTLNPVTGDLIWDAPLAAGEYNIAILVTSFRFGNAISIIERDMQIVIGTCTNHPPEITPMADTCIVAGDTLAFDVFATDPDGDDVTLTSTGGPYVVADPAVFTTGLPAVNVTGHFEWETKCHHIRRQPYYVQFKAKDDNPQVQLVDLKGRNIYVIGPAPANPAANPISNSMILTWDPSLCSNAIGYAIYRRNGIYAGTIECPCQTGVPSFTGYTLIDTVGGLNNTTYTDNDHGNGLVPGDEYCYLITALYPDGAESCASIQVCATLKKDLPVITNASVNVTDPVIGSVYVAWSRPSELDTIQFPPPYEYRVYHSNDFFGVNFSSVPFATFNDLNDTIVVDTLINTFTTPWSYKIELYYNNAGTPAYKGSSQKASTVFLTLSPTDNKVNLSWEVHVPWTNYRYDIFRLDTSSSASWDSIGTSTIQSYSDSGLTNGNQYCYYIRSVGAYSSPGLVDPIINLSQDTCTIPSDNVSPCAPHVTVITDCVDEQNGLTWNNPDPVCADDVKYYKIYFNSPAVGDYVLIATINDPNTTTFVHANLTSLAGCYKVTAVDSVGNESTDAIESCVDTCREYVLPSVFTPNGDGLNDLFHPCDQTTDPDLQKKNCPPYKNVKDVQMKIFNRWGNLEFETTNKDILWDGKNKDSGNDCPDGVYYYVCTVNFYRLNGTESKDLHGYVQLIRQK